jgi:hypothetical protein
MQRFENDRCGRNIKKKKGDALIGCSGRAAVRRE